MSTQDLKVKERPILFSTTMVKAILGDRKDITRRQNGLEAVNGITREVTLSSMYVNIKGKLVAVFRDGFNFIECECPYGQPGDILWVRETLYQNGELGLEYFANKETIDESIIPDDYGPYGGDYTFRAIPNIHMPYWACRLKPRIKSISVERLHDITEEDAIREGVEPRYCRCAGGFGVYECGGEICDCSCQNWPHDRYKMGFMELWESINGEESWKSNPWVWRIEFEKIKQEETINSTL